MDINEVSEILETNDGNINRKRFESVDRDEQDDIAIAQAVAEVDAELNSHKDSSVNTLFFVSFAAVAAGFALKYFKIFGN